MLFRLGLGVRLLGWDRFLFLFLGGFLFPFHSLELFPHNLEPFSEKLNKLRELQLTVDLNQHRIRFLARLKDLNIPLLIEFPCIDPSLNLTLSGHQLFLDILCYLSIRLVLVDLVHDRVQNGIEGCLIV